MPGSYARLLYHIVFSTKGRANAIKPELQARLAAFVGGIVHDKNATLIRIGGMPDHVHLLVRTPTDLCVADLVRHVKSRSSRWVHETFATMSSFAWQEGYGAFTVSASQVAVVENYIAEQETHHRGRSFDEEFVALLSAHGVEFDPRFVLD